MNNMARLIAGEQKLCLIHSNFCIKGILHTCIYVDIGAQGPNLGFSEFRSHNYSTTLNIPLLEIKKSMWRIAELEG